MVECNIYVMFKLCKLFFNLRGGGGGGALKKNAPSGGRHENFWGISCEKSRFYAKKIIFFPILGGRPWIRP
jgi:hypothetical protein